MSTTPVLVPVAQVNPNALFLRSSVLTGSGNGLTFELDQSDATLILSVAFPDGTRVKQTMAMADLATAWVNTVRASA